MNLTERAEQLKIDIPAVFLAMKRRDVPWYAKAVAALTVAYALSPLDLVPDFVPVLGYVDDLLILPALVLLTVKLTPPAVMDACREEAVGLWENGRPKKWYYALPVALVWALLGWWIVRLGIGVIRR